MRHAASGQRASPRISSILFWATFVFCWPDIGVYRALSQVVAEGAASGAAASGVVIGEVSNLSTPLGAGSYGPIGTDAPAPSLTPSLVAGPTNDASGPTADLPGVPSSAAGRWAPAPASAIPKPSASRRTAPPPASTAGMTSGASFLVPVEAPPAAPARSPEQESGAAAVRFDRTRLLPASQSAEVVGAEAPEKRGERGDRSASPAASGDVVGELLRRDGLLPKIRSALSERLAVPAARASDEEIARRVSGYFAAYLRWRAGRTGFGSEGAYASWALSQRPQAAVERSRLRSELDLLTGHFGETYSDFFRQSEIWLPGLESFLDRLVAERSASGERSLRLRSFGVGYGQEPYSLALTVKRALERAGEDSRRWRVVIESYDVNIVSLWAAQEGVFREQALSMTPRPLRGDRDRQFAPTADPNLLRASEELRSWIEPRFLNLNDIPQQTIMEHDPADVVFANHVLIHLAVAASHALAERLIQGGWARNGGGYLSLSEILVTEVKARQPGFAGRLVSLENADPTEVLAGMNAGGPIYRTVALFPERLRHGLAREPRNAFTKAASAVGAAWAWLRLGEPRLGLAAWRSARRYLRELELNAAHEEALDPAAARLIGERFGGLRLGLLADGRPFAYDPRTQELRLNVSWLLSDPASLRKRLAALEKIAARTPPSTLGPTRKNPFPHPSFGRGIVEAQGSSPDGAVLKWVRFAEQDRLIWMVGSRYHPVHGLRRAD